MKVHLVDGTFELFRCYMAMRAAEGDPSTNAARGFLHTMVALLRRPDVTHVGVAFDTVVDARIGHGKDPGPWNQHQLAADLARALGLVIWPMIRRYEADDALATAAARFAPDDRVDQIVLCTRDKDLAQCVVGDRIVMLDRVNDIVTDEAMVVEKWGVPPRLIPALLALVGDKSDGLPGVPGWGKTSAAAVLNHFGEIEQIPEAAETWNVAVRGADRLAAELAARKSEALLYRDLIRLARDVPIRESVDDLEWRGAHGRLADLAHSIGAADVPDRVPRWLGRGSA